MRLTSWEEERLLIFSAAELARRHRTAGLLLNAPEAVALICDAMLEAARAGRSYADVEAAGLAAVALGDVLPGVRELVEDVRLEVLLDDGVRLMLLVDPLGAGASGAPARTAAAGDRDHEPGPGAIVPGDADAVDPTAGLERRELVVANTSRRVIRVSSHFPFHRVNPRLEFDRERARGYRLDLPAGSSTRWGPGEAKAVRLVRFRGTTPDEGTEA